VPVIFLLIASATAITLQSTGTSKMNFELSRDKIREKGHSS
jgi:hypothetical protein